MEKPVDQTPHSQRPGISYHALFIGIGSFACGVVAVLIFMKAVGAAEVEFSITGIISFVFGVALSSASIVLAVAAISLGRVSERTMVERSDESIRLQNEVFMKTTEALGRIESSTGVTEKRIEDIIAGRAGAIADRLVEHRRIGPRNREEIEREIREGLLADLPLSSRIQREERDSEDTKKANEARKNYDEFKDNILFHVADHPSTKTRKIGDGHFGASGEDLADGVFETPSGRVAICTFSADPILASMFGVAGHFSQFADAILKELASGAFQKALLIFDRKLDTDSGFTKQIEKLRAIAKEGLLRRVAIIDGEHDEVLEEITNELLKSTAEALETAAPDQP